MTHLLYDIPCKIAIFTAKKMTLKNEYIISLVAIGVLWATSQAVEASEPIKISDEYFTVDTLLHVTVGPGMVTTGIRLSGSDKSNSAVLTNVFYTEIDLRNPNLVLTGVQALDEECGSENILNMGNRKNRQGQLQYIAGVNGDHANLNGDRKRTNGIAFMDDLLYNYGVGDDNWKMFESYITVENLKDINISEYVKLTLPLKFPNGTEYNIHINSPRHEDYLVIYTPERGVSTLTNPWGKECTMRLIEGSLPGCDAVFEVTSTPVGECNNNPLDGNMTIPADGYVLSGVGAAFYYVGQLKIGDRLSMKPVSFSIAGQKATDITTIIGGCPVIVSNGTPITTSECTSLNRSTAIQITPTARTAIGYSKEHNRLILAVTDAYKSNGHTSGVKATYGMTSSGLDFRTLAKVMIYLGCHTAQAMDGGGSSQLFNNKLGICNIPYGLSSYLRPVANGFFAADSSPDDNEIAYIEVLQKSVRLNNGDSFIPTVYGYNRYGVLVEKELKDFTLTVNNSLGSVKEKAFTASSLAGTTTAIVSYGDLRCGVRMSINEGGDFISSGVDAPIMVKAPYLNEDPTGFEDVTIDSSEDGTAEYFNLQGIRVNNPQRGLFISRSRDEIKKVIICP